MSSRIEITQRTLDALSRSDEAALRCVLSEAPAFVALNVDLRGIDEVLARIARQPTREMYRAKREPVAVIASEAKQSSLKLRHVSHWIASSLRSSQ
jgi:hypothetical protein